MTDPSSSTPRYRPADSFASPRFTGVRTFMRLPHLTSTDGVDVAFAGLPFDTGASFKVGARFGPEAIRSAPTTRNWMSRSSIGCPPWITATRRSRPVSSKTRTSES